MRFWKSTGLLAPMVMFLALSMAAAGELGPKMRKIVKGLVKTAEQKAPELAKASIAVFPFQTDEKLAKKRVDHAVVELLTHEFLQHSEFRLVERAQLNAVLKEQKLGLTGAIDSATAAKVGKLIGARLVVLGNVSRLGKSYQIGARLVDTQTSDILSSETVEVSVEVFDEEAARYLMLVPETEALGIYVTSPALGTPSQTTLPAQTHSGTVITPSDCELRGAGGPTLGVRYWVHPKWMLDLSFNASRLLADGCKVQLSNGDAFQSEVNSQTLRLLLHRTWLPSEKFRLYAGAGFSTVFISVESVPMSSAGGGTVSANTKMETSTIFLPTVRLGGEWRPKKRFGLGLFASYRVAGKEFQENVSVSSSGVEINTMAVRKIAVPSLTLEASLSVYF